MSYQNLNNMIVSLADKLDDQTDISTPLLAAKIQKCLAQYPYDQTLGAMSRVIEQMEINNKLFIKKAQLKELYQKLYTHNTKFADLFKDEMGDLTLKNQVKFASHEVSKQEIKYEIQDSVLANHLASVFDHTIPFKSYSEKVERQSLKLVETSLNAWNLKPNKLFTVQGNENILIIQADYETPKGITSFYIPVDTSNNQVKQSEVFIGNTGPQNLNHISIKNYLTSETGQKLKLSSSVIFDIFKKATSENREVSNAEVALTRFIAKKQGTDTSGILGQKLDAPTVSDVELPKSQEFSSFEEQFTSPYGQAKWQFGKNVDAGISHLTRQLQSFGYKNPQISVLKNDNKGISFAVSLNSGKIAFTVPIKITQNQIQKPSVILCNGEVKSFDKISINELDINNQVDYKLAAQVSVFTNEKPSDLINIIKSAMLEENYLKAQDALNVLKNSGNEQAYAIGFDTYLKGLNKELKPIQSQCSLVVKNASSQHSICGHTNLPLHKVYQDQHGNCHPLYRRGMDEKYEGVSFINAKIFGV